MALFPMSGVLRGFAPAACEEAVCGVQMYASTKTLACPAIALFRATTDAALLIEKSTYF